MARDPFAVIRQFYEDGGYIKRRESPAEKRRRIKMALYGSSQMDFSGGMAGGGRVGFDIGGGLPLAVAPLSKVNWIRNMFETLPKAQQKALELVSTRASSLGKEGLVFGSLPTEGRKGYTSKMVPGTEDSVELPPRYGKMLNDIYNDPFRGQAWTAHSHPGDTGSAVPSLKGGDMSVWANYVRGMQPQASYTNLSRNIPTNDKAYGQMLIRAPGSNTTTLIHPMSEAWKPGGVLQDASERADLLNKLDYAGIYGPTMQGGKRVPGMRDRQIGAIVDWAKANGVDIPELGNWSSGYTWKSNDPIWMPYQQAHGARAYDVLSHYGVPVSLDPNQPFAKSKTTQGEALPSWMDYWRRYGERPNDPDYGMSAPGAPAPVDQQLDLFGKARGGRIGFADGSRVGRLLKSIGNDFGRDWGQRAVQAGDLTDLSRFNEKALRQAFSPSETGRLMVMKPSQFENFALPLGREDKMTMGGNYATFNSPRDFVGNRDDYLRSLQNIAKTSGLREVPYLNFGEDKRLLQSGEALPQMTGHEGRHRMRALAAMGDDPTLVRLGTRGAMDDLDERQAAYEKFFGANRNVIPEIYKGKNIEDWTDIAPTIATLPKFWADGGRVGFDIGGATGRLLRMLKRYSDPAATKIADWKWRPLDEAAKMFPRGVPTEVPEHVLNYGDFIQRMRDKAEGSGLDPRDALKAYTTTLASIQRQARNRDLFPGMKFSSDEQMIRPEGAFSDWLGTKMGQRYLDRGAKGEVDPEAIADMQKRLHSFGLMPTLGEAMANAPGVISEHAPGGWGAMMHELPGIDAAKKGFMGSMLGYGDRPTFDARQIGLHVLPDPNPRIVQNMTRRGSGLGGEEAVQRLAARQRAFGVDLPPEYEPDYQHLVHHTVWDALNQTTTPHADIMDLMENRAHGGRIGFQEGGAGVLAAPLKLVNLLQRAAAMRGEAPEVTAKLLEKTKEGVKGAAKTQAGLSTRTGTAPFEDVTAKIAPSPFTPPPRTLTPESIPPYSWMVGGMSDLTGAGPTVHAINGTRLYRPVELSGGSDFPYWQQYYNNPNQLWAAAKAPLSGMYNALRSAGAKSDDPTFFVNKLMGPTSGDQSNMAMSAVEQMLRRGAQSPAEADKLTEMIRNYKTSIPDPVRSKQLGKMTTMYASPMPDFPHVRSDELHDYLMNLPMGQRSALMKVLDKKAAQDLGAPNPAAIRFAINDPALFGVERGSVGRTVGGFELGAPLIDDPAMPHPSYPTHMPGTVQGGLDRPVPGQLFFPDAWKELSKQYKDPGVLMSNFMNKPVVQQATPEWLDKIMPLYEQIQKGWSPSGLARGGRPGEAHVSMPHMPTTMPQYGPMHYGSSGMARGGRTAFSEGGVVGARKPTRDQLRYHSSMWQEDWG